MIAIHRGLVAVACSAGVLFAIGCSSRSHGFLGLTWDDNEVPQSVHSVCEPLRQRAIPRVAIAYHYPAKPTAGPGNQPVADEENAADGKPDEPDYREFPREVIGRRITDVLRRTGAFLEITELGTAGPEVNEEGSGRPDGEVPAPHAEPHAPDREQLAAEARAEGASYLVLVSVDDPRLVRTSIEPIVSTLMWLLGGFPAWWVSDHRYRMQYGLTAEIHDLASGRDASRQELGTMAFEDTVNFIERTNNVGSFILCWVCPTTFCPVNDDAVASGFSGYVLRERLPDFVTMCDERMTGSLVEARLEPQPIATGADIELLYPRPRVPVMVADDRIVLDLAVRPAPDRTLQRVVINGRTVFPATGEAAPGAPRTAVVQPYRRLRICSPFTIEHSQLQVAITDSAGQTATRVIQLVPHDAESARRLLRADQ